MDLTTARHILFWCSLINYGILIAWVLLMIVPHDWQYRLVRRLYRVSSEQYDVINLAGIMLYKILILAFNIVPYIALLIVG